MQYNVHFFVGVDFTRSVENVGRKLIQCGGEVLEHANLYMVDNSSSGTLAVSNLNVHDQASKETGNIQSTPIGWTDIASGEGNNWSSTFERSIYREILSVNRAIQGSLPIFFHFPMYKKESISLMETLCKGIIQSNLPVDIAFIGYGDDMASVINPDSEVKATSSSNVAAFEKLRGMSGLSKLQNRFIFIQNSNVKGIPLGIDEPDAFADMLLQLMILFPAHMDKIYPMEPHDVIGLGFSSLSFDKYKFSRYLLQKGILQTIDNASINVESIDINDAFTRINSLFSNRDKFLSVFIDENKKNDIDEDQQNELFKGLKTKVELLKKDVEKIFAAEKSIPFKAALLAALLSKTEYELFSSSVYNQSSLCYLDLYNESINHFIENDEADYYQINGEKVINPIERIKVVNKMLINGEEQIRTLEKRLLESESYIENSSKVDQCLKDDEGFKFGENKFRLMPNVIEEPLLETYEPKPFAVNSVDLRPYFSSIKNQGNQGSCMSHTLVSMFEFMMKVNQAEECDLSEAFVYYNSRKLAGNLHEGDVGSILQPSVDSLVQYGVALEKYCPYNPDVFDKEPSETAYQDAATRKLIKALKLNKKSDDIRSALAEGYPVAGSFKLTENFTKDPYVEMPTEEEIAKAYEESSSSHAMVIVGFNDDLQMFLVRNSWGSGFGINGYCYMPYEYINNEKLFNWAFIMTEVASMKRVIPDLKEIKALRIDNTDSRIRYFVNKAALNVEKQMVEKLREEKAYLQEYLETVRTSFASANSRDSYVAANKAKLNSDKVELEKQIANHEKKQEELKKEFESFQKKTIITMVIVIASLFAFWIIANFSFEKYINSWLETNLYLKYKYYAILSGLTFLWAVVVIYLKKRDWINDRDLIENKIVKARKDINVINHKIKVLGFNSFAAWMIIRTLEDINEHFLNLYSKMISLINNLREWYREVNEDNSSMALTSSPLEISLLDKGILNSYFSSTLGNSDVFDVDLTEGLENYEITAEFLSSFKLKMIEGIRKRLVEVLQSKGFNISAHISGHDYENMAKSVVPNMISALKYQSGIFMRLNLIERGYVATTTIALAPDLDRFENNVRSKLANCDISDVFEMEDKNRIMLVTSCSYKYDECVMLKK